MRNNILALRIKRLEFLLAGLDLSSSKEKLQVKSKKEREFYRRNFAPNSWFLSLNQRAKCDEPENEKQLRALYLFWYCRLPFNYFFGEKFSPKNSVFWKKGRPKSYPWSQDRSPFLPFLWFFHRMENEPNPMKLEDFYDFWKSFQLRCRYLGPLCRDPGIQGHKPRRLPGGIFFHPGLFFQGDWSQYWLSLAGTPGSKILPETPANLRQLQALGHFYFDYLAPAHGGQGQVQFRRFPKSKKLEQIFASLQGLMVEAPRLAMVKKFWHCFALNIMEFHGTQILETFARRYFSLKKKWEKLFQSSPKLHPPNVAIPGPGSKAKAKGRPPAPLEPGEKKFRQKLRRRGYLRRLFSPPLFPDQEVFLG